MKQLLLHPLILTLLFLAGSVYFVIAFKFINSNNQWSKLFEQACATVFIMIIGGVSVGLMKKFHPNVLFFRVTKLPTLVITIAAYSSCLVLLAPRLNKNLKDSVYVFASFFKKNIFFATYILLIILSCLSSNLPIYTLKASLVYIGVTLALIYIGKVYSWKDLLNILTLYHGAAVIVYVLFGQDTLGHKNYVGPTMALSAILLYLKSRTMPKYKIIVLGLIILSLIFTQQVESGMAKALTVILICLLVFLEFLKTLSPRIAFACISVFLAIGISMVILITENAEYIIVEKLGEDITLTGRTLFWPLIVNAINKHPLFGYGYLGFWQEWRGSDDPSYNIRTPTGFKAMHSHNGFLDIAVDFGWIGLSLFIISLLVNIYYGVLHLIRTKDTTAGLPLIIFTWLVISNVTETNIVTINNGWTFYVLMTARLTMDMDAKKQDTS